MPKTLKSLKTPLRYPGGKSRAVVKLLQYLPDLTQVKEFREPFLGGGSVALEITKRYPHIEIWVNDLYEPLYNFWCELRDNGQDLQDAILSKKNQYPDPTKEQLKDKEFKYPAKKLFNHLCLCHWSEKIRNQFLLCCFLMRVWSGNCSY